MWNIIWAPIAFTVGLFSLLMAQLIPKSQGIKAGELQATGADEGGSIPVVFGTCDVSPNVTAFLAGTPKAIKKKG